MSAQSMKMVSMIGEYDKLNETVEACIKTGCFQPEHTSDLVENIKGFFHINDENPFSGMLHRLNEIFESAGIEPEIILSDEKVSDEEAERFIDLLDNRLKEVQQKRQELTRRIEQIHTDLSNLERFDGIKVNLRSAFSAEFVKVRFGKIPIDGYEKLPAYQSNPYVMFFPCSSDENYYWGMYLAPVDESREVDRIFASLFFERLRLPASTGTPHEAVDYLKSELAECERQLKIQDDLIDGYFTGQREECMKLYTFVKSGYDAYEIRRYATRYRNSFLLVGWVPEADYPTFAAALGKIEGLEIRNERPDLRSERLKPPTKMKNPRIFRPFEYYVEMYGVPNYREIDPTVFVAITYCLLFGIMFADVGQGIVLAIAGLIMYKKMKMPIGKILVPCGVAGTLGGLVFGSFFGFEHALDPLYHAIGFAEKPIDVMESATTLLGFSIALGVVLIILAMCLNVYSCFKQRKPADAIFGHNGLAGILFFVSILAVVCSMAFGLNLPILPIVLGGCVVPIILIFLKNILANLMAGKKALSGSVGDYIIENFFELFEVILSYITNTLSFLRVGAFVLVHAVMMMVFFSLADMTGGGVFYVVIVVFGNAFVTLLEGLLVNIQVLRLEFYEMFSRFYIGEGVPFEPVRIQAK